MKISSIALFALALVVSIGTMFAADPPPWAYGFEGPPQPGATVIPVGPANTDQTPRSIPGATAGGFILAVMEELGAGYISSGFRDGMGFLLIILILLVKPTGLFTQKDRIG